MTRPAIPSGAGLEIKVDHRAEETVVSVSGHINVDTSPELRERLRVVLSGGESSPAVTIDLADVPYIETSGVATLIEALRAARHRGINLRLQGLSGAVLRLIEVTGVKAMFEPGGQEPGGEEQKVV